MDTTKVTDRKYEIRVLIDDGNGEIVALSVYTTRPFEGINAAAGAAHHALLAHPELPASAHPEPGPF